MNFLHILDPGSDYAGVCMCFVSEHESVRVCLCVVGDLAHFNLWQREDVVKTIITVALSLITAR